jgi:hypothetical protein
MNNVVSSTAAVCHQVQLKHLVHVSLKHVQAACVAVVAWLVHIAGIEEEGGKEPLLTASSVDHHTCRILAHTG